MSSVYVTKRTHHHISFLRIFVLKAGLLKGFFWKSRTHHLGMNRAEPKTWIRSSLRPPQNA